MLFCRGLLLVLCLSFGASAFAQPKSPYPEAKHGKGELKQIDGLAVLKVAGTPKELGEQLGILIGKNAPDPTPVLEQFLKEAKVPTGINVLKFFANKFKPGVHPRHLEEMEAMQKASGFDLDLILLVNTIYDLSSNMGCSTFIAEKDRSSTGAPLFGRNFDWLASKGLPEQTMVIVVKPEKQHAFAIVTFAPIMGCISGMNDAGLCCTINEIMLKSAKDKSKFKWEATPMLLAFRRVLEECKTVAEAEKLLKEMKRTTSACLTICDAEGGAVFEITPDSLVVRKAVNGVCCCTNHFCTEELGTGKKCPRLEKLIPAQKAEKKFAVNDVFDKLHEVNQGKSTMQSMVFEPAEKVLHLKIGEGASTATKAKTIKLDLGKLFKE